MKKLITALLTLTMVVSLAACGGGEETPQTSGMSVRPAQLTQEEQNLLELLGTDEPVIFDFTAGTSAKSLHIQNYHLVDGAWVAAPQGDSYAFQQESGRIALAFDQLPSGLQVSLQTPEGGTSFCSFESTEDPAIQKNLAFVTARLSGETELNYEEEIPLVVQGMTSGSSVYTLDVSDFQNPEAYLDLGYEKVYAITLMVSENALSSETPETPEGEEAPPAEE